MQGRCAQDNFRFGASRWRSLPNPRHVSPGRAVVTRACESHAHGSGHKSWIVRRGELYRINRWRLQPSLYVVDSIPPNRCPCIHCTACTPMTCRLRIKAVRGVRVEHSGQRSLLPEELRRSIGCIPKPHRRVYRSISAAVRWWCPNCDAASCAYSCDTHRLRA